MPLSTGKARRSSGKTSICFSNVSGGLNPTRVICLWVLPPTELRKVLSTVLITQIGARINQNEYRPLSLSGHLDFTPFQLIVTKLRLDGTIVWCHVCAMNVGIHQCYGNREHVYNVLWMMIDEKLLKIHVNRRIRTCKRDDDKCVVGSLLTFSMRLAEAREFTMFVKRGRFS